MTLKIKPIGGVAEIGSNMVLFSDDNFNIIVDCGILFPKDNLFNIKYLIPDIHQLDKTKKYHLVITHGHEDHIGAVPHLILEGFDVEIYAGLLAYELIKRKFEFLDIVHPIKKYRNKEVLTFGEISITPLLVAHSIPFTYSLIIKKNNDVGVFYCSDFKIDKSHPQNIDVDFLKKNMASAKNKVFMIDSTNILVPTPTVSESELVPQFEKLLSVKKRTFLTMFFSNIDRLKNILDICRKNKRNVIIWGASAHKYIQVALEIDHIEDYSVTDINDCKNIDNPNNVILIAGSQFDFYSSLKVFSDGNVKKCKPLPGDQFVYSAKPIPGNEKTVYSGFNNLTKNEVNIINSKEILIHASGHLSAPDIVDFVKNFEIDYYIPIHGESYFLKKHSDLIEGKFPQIKVVKIENSQEVTVSDAKVYTSEIDHESSPLLIMRNNQIIEKSFIKDRRKVATNGLCVFNKKNDSYDLQLLGISLSEGEMKQLHHVCETHLNEKENILKKKLKDKISSFTKEKPVILISL